VASCQWASRPWRPSALALACRTSRLFIGRPLELVVEFEPGRSDGNVARLDMVGQIGGDGRQLLALMAPSLEGEADGGRPGVRKAEGPSAQDGGILSNARCQSAVGDGLPQAGCTSTANVGSSWSVATIPTAPKPAPRRFRRRRDRIRRTARPLPAAIIGQGLTQRIWHGLHLAWTGAEKIG